MNTAAIASLLSILNFIGLLVVGFFLFRMIGHYNALIKGTNSKDLVASLGELMKTISKNKQDISAVDQRLTDFIEKSRIHFQKIGFTRYNPFTNTGGDQSFILCLLDENLNGVVISSLHSRENTRIYAKQITKGAAPDQVLSKEEKQVINQAIKA